MLRLYTHFAAKRPLAASLSVTPALGHRRCLIVFTVFRGAANDREMFSVAGRQERIQLQATPMHVLKVLFDIRCHEKDCNRQDTSSPNPRIPPIHQDFDQTPGRRGQQEATRPEGIVQDTVQNVRWPTSFVTPFISYSGFETKTTSSEFWSNRARQPTTAERPI